MNSFAENFWGEKNNGFDVLYHNMKHGHMASKDFSDFLRESCNIEESYVKLLGKLAKQVGNSYTHGSFTPLWQLLRALTEKISNLHMQLVHAWQDLLKDVVRYSDEQHKKHKMIKDTEASTMDTVNSIQQTTMAVHKAKEYYHARYFEFEKLKREGGSQKDLERAETKSKKAHDEYRALIEKYENTRNDFDKKMTDSCKRFQDAEEHHITQMKDFMDTYGKAWEHHHALLGRVHAEYKSNNDDLTVTKLMEIFVNAKTTGREKPGLIEFEDADLSSLQTADNAEKKEIPLLEKPSKTGAIANDASVYKKLSITGALSKSISKAPHYWQSVRHRHRAGDLAAQGASNEVKPSSGLRLRVPGFLSKSKRDKKNKEKKKKKKEKEKENEEEEKVPQVDEEGFSIRPDNPFENMEDKNSWSSDSSDSDSEDEKRRIKVEIKPFSPNGTTPTDNVDDIRKSIEGLRLSPQSSRRTTQSDPNMKRSISVSETMNATNMKRNSLSTSYAKRNSISTAKPTQDLLGLDLFGSSSSASTPTGGNYSFPPPRDHASAAANASASSAEFFIGSPADMPPSVPVRRAQGASTPTGPPLLPAPPIPRTSPRGPQLASKVGPLQATARPTGRQSPAPNRMDRADSLSNITSSMTFTTTSMPYGSSRGPSPLTIGMADTIPLAVAFSETVNALFKGTNSSSCKVKVMGDMMVSFPAGIVRVLTENPSPAMLSFKVKNVAKIENILVNKQLIVQDMALSTADTLVYTFEMNALTEHLRRQADQNKAASYFNIDIIKYQVLPPAAGGNGVPLQLAAFWKCEPEETDFRLDYRYNGDAVPHRNALSSVTILVPLDGEVSGMEAKPEGKWSAEHKRAMWRLGDVSEMSEEGSQGCLRAKFHMKSGPAAPAPTAVQFMCEGSTLSGVDFELMGAGYRVSLVKKRFVTGKYIAEPEGAAVKYV